LQIPVRIALTLVLGFGLVDLTERIAIKVSQYTSHAPASTMDSLVQGRRTVVNRIARATALMESDPAQATTILLRVVQQARDPQMREAAANHLERMAVSDWPDDHRRSFLTSIAQPALESAREHQIPPSIILAQAALESGWGRSALARKHHNLFGVKGTSGQATTAYPTLEFGPKGVHIVRATFRTFASTKDSIDHHGRLLASDERYRNAMAQSADWKRFLAELAPVYASDPHYAHRVTQIIDRYQLDRWDALMDDQQQES
jgi:flagellum-specific peptidoglycan hydrolase FlgJ